MVCETELVLLQTQRIHDLELDGVDAEILFPNKGLVIWATPDPEFSQAMCRTWNEWAWETFADYNDRLCPDGMCRDS